MEDKSRAFIHICVTAQFSHLAASALQQSFLKWQLTNILEEQFKIAFNSKGAVQTECSKVGTYMQLRVFFT